MSFTDPGSQALAGFNCPAVADNAAVQADALALTTAFLESRLRGEAAAEPMALAWAAGRPAEQLRLALKEAPAPASAVA